MKNENFITIQGWMVNELGLSGNDLICYALVYGFSQDEESEFSGSLSYVAGCLNITKQNARKVLLRLVEKGLIAKRDEEVTRGIKLCRYSAKVKKDTAVSKEQRGMAKTATDNKEDNIEEEEEKDKSFSKKDDFPSLAAEPTAEYCEKKTKAQIAQDIVDFWNANTTAFPKVRITSQDIIVAVDKLQKRGYSVDDIKKAILLCNTLSDFYKGKEKGNKWKATLQWLIKNTKDNFDLIMNGALHTSEQQQKEYNRIISASSIDSIHEDYIPELGDVFWSERNNMYAFIGDISDVYDGYTNENRPNGAKLFQNGYTFVWSSKEKRWIKP